MDGPEDLSGFLLGAKHRYRTARARIRRIINGALATESARRFLDWRIANMPPRGGFFYLYATDEEHETSPEYDPPGYEEHEDLAESSRLWHEPPGRWRQETYAASGTEYEASDGGERWTYDPAFGAHYTDRNYGASRGHPGLAFLLDPEKIGYEIGDSGPCRELDRGAPVAGRETRQLLVPSESWYHPAHILADGANDHLLSVDAETGVILRAAARLGGEEFHVVEAMEIHFDERLPDSTFRLDLPGVKFRRM